MTADPMERPRGGTGAVESTRCGGRDTTSLADVHNGSGVGAQLDLIAELERGRRQRDAGVNAAAANTWSPWRLAAHDFVVGLAPGSQLTSDTIVEAVGLPLGSRNATGAFVQACIRSGLVEWTGRITQSTRASRHGGWIKVYRRGTGGGE